MARLGLLGLLRRSLLLALPLLELLEARLARGLRVRRVLRLARALGPALGDLLRHPKGVSPSETTRGKREGDGARTAFSDSTVDRRESRPASDTSVSYARSKETERVLVLTGAATFVV